MCAYVCVCLCVSVHACMRVRISFSPHSCKCIFMNNRHRSEDSYRPIGEDIFRPMLLMLSISKKYGFFPVRIFNKTLCTVVSLFGGSPVCYPTIVYIIVALVQ